MRLLSSGLPGSSVMPSPCCPPLASWAKVVITYLLSDFRGLWQAMQFSTRIGATSRMKLTGFAGEPTPGWAGRDAAGFVAVVPALTCDRPASGFPVLRTATPLAAARSEPAGGVFLACPLTASPRVVAKTHRTSPRVKRVETGRDGARDIVGVLPGSRRSGCPA